MRVYRIKTKTGETRWAESKDGENFFALLGGIEAFARTDEKLFPAKILAPVVPPAIYIIGFNYSDDPPGARKSLGPYPVIVMKAASTVVADGDLIEIPGHLSSNEVDYEGELAVVIGRAAKNVSRRDALDHVLGYTVANDLTARDWQRNGAGGQWVRGKNFDTFCPLGPSIVTRDSLDLADGIGLRTWVNGELRQEDSTGSMVFPVEELIEFLSGNNTLLPGTVILTGTPHGTGKQQDRPVYLQSGDVVRVEIDGIGCLTNPVA